MEPQAEFEDYLRREKIKPILLRGYMSVLDVGCGSGRVWKDCSRPPILVGVEPDEKLAAQARITPPYRKVYRLVREVPDIASFECVAALGVVEHVDNPMDFVGELSDAKRLYLTVPNGDSFHRHLGKELGVVRDITELGIQDLDIGHKRVYTFDTFNHFLMQVFSRFGYYTTEIGSLSFKFGTSTQMMTMADKVDGLNQTAYKLGIAGAYKRHGAELYALLERR